MNAEVHGCGNTPVPTSSGTLGETPAEMTSSNPPSRADLGRGVVARWCRRTWLAAVNLVLPPRCAFCGVDIEPEDGEPLLCETCNRLLVPGWRLGCRRCGTLVPQVPEQPEFVASKPLPPAGRCLRCRRQPYYFDGVIPLGPYRDELRQAVVRMKQRTGDHLAGTMGELYAQRRANEVAAFRPDVVVPIPMHWSRQMVRRTNSPEILAARISRHLGVPSEGAMLVRRRNTLPQAGLPPTKRFENVRGAFRLGRGYAIKDARVLLVDDVLTTGATCSEAAKVLRKAGAQIVLAAVVARTDQPRA